MKTLILYGTDYCHLCEQAEALLRELPGQQYHVKKIDISESDELMDRFALRIPVVQIQYDSEDLGWPFNSASLADYLNKGSDSTTD